ncbi:hypothetical protein V1477_003338 [Vespula maculifrons]|uniref:Uncharacterized protein n=1 Tax=Vespula maculifrons TaxID=7453 RepID=A0ABD2CUA5_VESMC
MVVDIFSNERIFAFECMKYVLNICYEDYSKKFVILMKDRTLTAPKPLRPKPLRPRGAPRPAAKAGPARAVVNPGANRPGAAMAAVARGAIPARAVFVTASAGAGATAAVTIPGLLTRTSAFLTLLNGVSTLFEYAEIAAKLPIPRIILEEEVAIVGTTAAVDTGRDRAAAG